MRALCLVAGWVVLAFALDLGIGAALEAVRPRPDARAPSASELSGAPDEGVPTGACPDDAELTPDSRTRATAPAYGDAPWIEEYWCEFDRVGSDYVPYLFSRHRGSEQPLIQEADGVRRSYQPADLPADAPTVWFFGGSTMWGWGQRDEHTIPSEVSRLAEAAGTPVRVVNLGQLAWVHWQEVLAFEQELADRPAPDLVVFYDGVNDVNVQMDPEAVALDGRPSRHPTIYDFGIDPPAPVPGPFSAPPPEPGDDDWTDWWSEHSAVARLGGALGGLFGVQPAFAQDAEAPASDPTATAERVVDIYERARVVADGTARRHGVRPLYFWQPRSDVGGVGPVHHEARRRLDGAVVDLDDAFRDHDQDEIYTDGAHTNELGAELVAEAMWPHVRAALRERGLDG